MCNRKIKDWLTLKMVHEVIVVINMESSAGFTQVDAPVQFDGGSPQASVPFLLSLPTTSKKKVSLVDGGPCAVAYPDHPADLD